jgi:acetyltransferase-like isoleucine patch superfamily enzyme
MTSIFDYLTGTPFIVSYFRALGSKIGKNCCLYPAGADPFMSEPDLVTIGNGVVVDMASIVCHLNTKGNFELVKIKVDDHATLRTRSRIQQGVHVEAGAMILEKSLALTGEVIENDSVWQGSPASKVFEYDINEGIVPSTSFGSNISDDEHGSGNQQLEELVSMIQKGTRSNYSTF